MPEYVPFASNYIDRSTSYAFQFEFFCWRCGSGYMSRQEVASSAGASAGGFAASKALGIIPVVGDFIGDKASDAIGDKAKEGALQRAVAEMAQAFAQCPQCGQYRCRARCWNAAAGRCLSCAPAYAAPAPGYPPAPAPYAPPATYGAPAPYSTPYQSAALVAVVAQPYPPYPPAPPSMPLSAPAPYPAPYGQPMMAPYPVPPRQRSTALAVVLEFLLAGTGLMYAGRGGQGVAVLILTIAGFASLPVIADALVTPSAGGTPSSGAALLPLLIFLVGCGWLAVRIVLAVRAVGDANRGAI